MSAASFIGARGKSGEGSLKSAVGLILLLPVLIILLAVILVWGRQGAEREATETRIASAARLAAARITLVTATDLQLLEQFDSQLGPDPARFSSGTVSGRRQGRDGVQGASFVLVFDAAGDLRATGALEFAALNISGRDYFQELRDGAEWRISPLIVPAAQGDKVFAIARRLTRKNAFAGIAVIYAPADMLSDDWATAGLGANSALGFVRDDGQLIARYPVPDEGIDLSDNELFTEHLPASPSGVYRAVSPIDGVGRTIAYARVDTLPVIAIASISNALIAEENQKRLWSTVAMTTPIWLALLLTCFWMIVLMRRNVRARSALELAVSQNRVLL